MAPPSAKAGTATPAKPSESSANSSPAGAAGSTAKQGSDEPLPKVQRSNAPARPSLSAKPATTNGTVSYGDGVRLSIHDVSFGKETGHGPGAFPGRAYAVFTIELHNGSYRTLSLNTVVVTQLDRSGQPVAPVYAEETKAYDFAGTLKHGATAQARYAFVVPAATRSHVTIVVDFDGVHTSAVFRGKLS